MRPLAIPEQAMEVVVIDGGTQARSVRRLAVAAWLRTAAVVCLVLAVVGAAVDFFGRPLLTRWGGFALRWRT